MQQITMPHFLQFPDPPLVQHDSGKMEAMDVLLQKLKARGHHVLILTRMIPVLHILKLYLNFHFLTYIRINESGAHSWHCLESIKKINQDKQFFCAVLFFPHSFHKCQPCRCKYCCDIICLIQYLKSWFCKALCSEYGKEDSRKFTEETQSEIRDGIGSELHDSRNTTVPSHVEQQASFVDQEAFISVLQAQQGLARPGSSHV